MLSWPREPDPRGREAPSEALPLTPASLPGLQPRRASPAGPAVMLGLARMWDLCRCSVNCWRTKGLQGQRAAPSWSSLVLPITVCSDAAAAGALCPREQDRALPEQRVYFGQAPRVLIFIKYLCEFRDVQKGCMFVLLSYLLLITTAVLLWPRGTACPRRVARREAPAGSRALAAPCCMPGAGEEGCSCWRSGAGRKGALTGVRVHPEAGRWRGNGRHQAGGPSAPESSRTPRMVLFLLTKKIVKAVCLKLWLMDCTDYLFIFK